MMTTNEISVIYQDYSLCYLSCFSYTNDKHEVKFRLHIVRFCERDKIGSQCKIFISFASSISILPHDPSDFVSCS